MEKESPFYPILSEAGSKEAQELIDVFKAKLIEAAKDVISSLYCDVAVFINSDSWTNFRNKILDGYKDYNNSKFSDVKYDFAEIRKQLYKDFREDIIKDLNQDMVKEIEELKNRIESLQNFLRH